LKTPTADLNTHGVIRTDRLTKTYALGRKNIVHALTEVSLTVGAGEIFALLGANGAGKTTLVKLLLNFVRATRGTAYIMGHPVHHPKARGKIGYVPEELSLPDFAQARHFLKFLGRLSGVAHHKIDEKASTLLKDTGLDQAGHAINKFSKGMKRRLSLAQALLHSPDLLILDEPTDGLDPLERHRVLQLLQKFRDNGGTILLCSHILSEVEMICDEYAILDNGQLVREGTRQDFLADGHRVSIAGTASKELLKNLPSECKIVESNRKVNIIVQNKADLASVLTLLEQFEMDVTQVEPNRIDLNMLFTKYVDKPTV